MKLLFENKSSIKPLVSIILLDWSCRESFHILHYLNKQKVPREQYEVIWIEYYNRRSTEIEVQLKDCEKLQKSPVVDKWIVMEMPDDVYYHKHLMYNVGIASSKGDIVVICDSDAMVSENFIKAIIDAFKKDSKIVLHFDQFRNTRRDLYPFNYPSFQAVIGEGCINNVNGKTVGVIDIKDPIHTRNYGACMCARRNDLIAIGGADEHINYLGYICGPYEMTFRLMNYGLREVWHKSEFIYHTWHPGYGGVGNFVGPHDTFLISTVALESFDSGRIKPFVENEAIQQLHKLNSNLKITIEDKLINHSISTKWTYNTISKDSKFKIRYIEDPLEKYTERLNTGDHISPYNELVRIFEDPELIITYKSFNIIRFFEKIYGLPQALGPVDFKSFEHIDHPAILHAENVHEVKKLIDVVGLSIIALLNKPPEILESYKEHNIVSYLNQIYGVPHSLGNVYLINAAQRKQPSILVGTTQDIKNQIDEVGSYFPENLISYKQYNILKYRNCFYGIPHILGSVDFHNKRELNNITILSSKKQKELEQLIDEVDPDYCDLISNIKTNNNNNCDETNKNKFALEDDNTFEGQRIFPVEYAGWLPAFEKFGNCGKHPQFGHLDFPPKGYKFVSSNAGIIKNWFEFRKKPAKNCDKLFLLIPLFAIRLFSLIPSILSLSFNSLKNGAKIGNIIDFFKTRHLISQLLLPRHLNLVLLPSVPYTYGQNPWLMEIEDTTSMFFPSLHNGKTSSLNIRDNQYYPIIKALLESKNCRGIITHIKSTADSIPLIFNNNRLDNKITHVPLGIKIPSKSRARKKNTTFVNILFTNSWHQNPVSFFLRGGLDVLESFSILREKYSNIRLTLRTNMPEKLDIRYKKIIERCDVRIIDYFLSDSELQFLFNNTNIYVLPSARIHVVSILEAMANGMAVVVSDGWGIEEYVVNGWNGFVIKGRYGKTSWIDSETGMFKENYEPMFKPDSLVIKGLVETLSALIENKQLRERIGSMAKEDVETKFNINNWNNGLKKAFGKALY